MSKTITLEDVRDSLRRHVSRIDRDYRRPVECQYHATSGDLDFLADQIDYAIRERDELRAKMQWQPIETAPKDIDVLLYHPTYGTTRGRWNNDRYARTPHPYWGNDRERTFGTLKTRQHQPIHWMPLPEPPAERGEG